MDFFLPTDTGSDWSMSDVRLTSDVVVLDSALMNSYSEHVLSGKSLNIQYGTYITMQQTVAGDNISVNVSRAVSRLKKSSVLLIVTVFILMQKRLLIHLH